jgi:hypothetical protein
VLVLAFVLQFEVILPVEGALFPSDDLSHASLLFIPHGLKMLAAYLLGIIAAPAIFVAQFFAGLFLLGANAQDAVVGALFGTIAAIAPVMLLNFMFKNKWSDGVALNAKEGIGTFRAFIAAVILSTFINSILHSAYYFDGGSITLPFRYLFGDILGSMIIFSLVMLLRRQILYFIARRISA